MTNSNLVSVLKLILLDDGPIEFIEVAAGGAHSCARLKTGRSSVGEIMNRVNSETVPWYDDSHR